MKRRITGLLMAGLLVFSGTGCAKVSTSSASSTAVTSQESEQEEVKADSAQDASDASSTGGTSFDSSVTETPTPTEAEKKRIEISIPWKEGMQSTYDTMEGLTMEKGSYIAVVAKDLSSGYWKAVKQGAEQAIEDLNTQLGYTGSEKVRMTFEGPDKENDIDTQINTIDAVLQENPTVLCLGIIDMQSCQAQLESAAENEIPTIIVDSGLQSDLITATCGIDNSAAGREAAVRLCQAIGDAGEVVIVAHQYNTQTSMERVEGFQKEIEENHPNVSIAQINYGDGEDSVAEMLQNTFAAHPGVTGIFCTNEVMGEETLAALKGIENTDQVKLVGFDSGTDQVKAVREGKEYGLISQNPYSLGYAAIVAAVRAATDLPVDSFVDTGYQWLDQETIDLEENQKYIYE